ncbi:hypothetical protein FB567DRAFT_211508 [Paraphoma chrysanthemicola]|uniref:DUF7730 domain-containing protein n=1 Tax=Paraphoma chrysanthemicola TaxID=798071 RepID=A0A8K0VSK2_9PLEO|nr:hypothetical protein FB567DRAFT_211508 [Paraphoma chrysanthemicola]
MRSIECDMDYVFCKLVCPIGLSHMNNTGIRFSQFKLWNSSKLRPYFFDRATHPESKFMKLPAKLRNTICEMFLNGTTFHLIYDEEGPAGSKWLPTSADRSHSRNPHHAFSVLRTCQDPYQLCAPLLFKNAQGFEFLDAATMTAFIQIVPQPFINTIKHVHFGGKSPILLTGFKKVTRSVSMQFTSLQTLSFSPARASEDEKRKGQNILEETLQMNEFNFEFKFSDMVCMT